MHAAMVAHRFLKRDLLMSKESTKNKRGHFENSVNTTNHCVNRGHAVIRHKITLL